jgi:hypothetical protein
LISEVWFMKLSKLLHKSKKNKESAKKRK